MKKIHCLNAISKYGTDLLTDDYALTDNMEEAEGVLVRSAAMHDMAFSDNLLAIARAGAGVNNIPLASCADQGIVVFNTPGANANGVKELVIAGMLPATWWEALNGAAASRKILILQKRLKKGKRHLQALKSRAKSWE